MEPIEPKRIPPDSAGIREARILADFDGIRLTEQRCYFSSSFTAT